MFYKAWPTLKQDVRSPIILIWLPSQFLQAFENLGMAMIYTLVTSAKEWLSERFSQDSSIENAEAEEAAKDEVRFILLIIFYL